MRKDSTNVSPSFQYGMILSAKVRGHGKIPLDRAELDRLQEIVEDELWGHIPRWLKEAKDRKSRQSRPIGPE